MQILIKILLLLLLMTISEEAEGAQQLPVSNLSNHRYPLP